MMVPIDDLDLRTGELYVFAAGVSAPSLPLLYGIFDRHDDRGRILLETATDDYREFRLAEPLPAAYRLGRLATRSELRDYAFNLGWARV